MPVLVISNFDDDLIKNERASMETPFSHYKSMESPLLPPHPNHTERGATTHGGPTKRPHPGIRPGTPY